MPSLGNQRAISIYELAADGPCIRKIVGHALAWRRGESGERMHLRPVIVCRFLERSSTPALAMTNRAPAVPESSAVTATYGTAPPAAASPYPVCASID